MVPTGNVGYRTNIDFNEENFWKQRTFPWRSWTMGYSVTKFEKLAQQNTGGVQPTVLVNIVKRLAEKAGKDFMDFLLPLVFQDGNAANINLMGLKSWTGHTGSLISGSSFLNPTDTYGRLSTILGNYGGSWDGHFPSLDTTAGDNFEYRFNVPMLLGYNSTLLSPTDASATHDWAHQWESAIRHLTGWSETIQPTPYDAIILHPQMLIDARDTLTDRTRFIAKSRQENTSVGFKEFDFEGLSLVTQRGVPVDEGHAVHLNELSIWSMQSDIIEKTTDEDITESTELVALDSYIQMLATSPSQFGALLPYPAGT
jgi:hypothetical protein